MSLLDWIFGRERERLCGVRFPDDEVTCLLPAGHDLFHKSHMHVWLNTAIPTERYAEMGRQFLRGDPGTFGAYSFKEVSAFVEAARAEEANQGPIARPIPSGWWFRR